MTEKNSRIPMLLTFAAFGAAVGSHVGALPEIIKTAAVGQQFFGGVNSFAMLAGTIAFALGGWINQHFDHRSVLIFMMPVLFVGLVAALIVASPITFAIFSIGLAFCFGMMDVFMNAEASAIEDTKPQSRFTTYHAAASLLMGFFAILSSFLSLHFNIAAVAAFALLVFIAAYVSILRQTPHRLPSPARNKEGGGALPRRQLALMGIVTGLTNSCEIAAILWAGQLLAQMQPDLAAYSGLGVFFYGCCSGIMRLFADNLRSKLGDMKLLFGSIGVAALGSIVLGFAPPFGIATVAFACVGAGLATVYPCLISLAGARVPSRRAAAIGFTTAIGGIPRFFFPFLFGTISAAYSMSGVFALCAGVLAVSMVILIFALQAGPQTDK